MNWFSQIRSLGLTWSGLIVSVISLALLVTVRRMLPTGRRSTGRAATWMLVCAPLLHFASDVTRWGGASRPAAVLDVTSLLLLCLGATGAVSVTVFDLGLSRYKIPSILRDLVTALAFAFVAATAASEVGLNPLSLLTTSAVLTAVLGLALQNIIANLFAGLALQIDGTFAIGDFISVGTRAAGEILEIRWRSTILRTREGDTLVVPNAQLISHEVLNFSRPRRDHRTTISVMVPASIPPGRVKMLFERVASSVEGVLADPPASCAPESFGGQQVSYGVSYWVHDYASASRIEGEVRTRLWYSAQREGLGGIVAMESSTLASRVATLGTVTLLDPLSADDRTTLATAVRDLLYTRGECLLREGEPGDSMLIIVRGEVVVKVGSDQQEVGRLGKGDVIGEMSLLTGVPRQATCIAVDEVACLAIDHTAMAPLLSARPALAESIANLLAEREKELEEQRRKSQLEVRAVGPSDATTLLSKIKRYFLL